MHSTRTLLSLAAALAALAGPASGSALANERRVATLAPVGSPWMEILEQGASHLAARTDGRVTIKFYPGGVQGDELDVVRKMQLGQLDGAALSAVGLSKIYPGIRVLQLPFLFASEAEATYVRDKMWPYFGEQFAAKGFRLQAPGGSGWDFLYTNRRVASLDDLRRVKMWTWSDDPVVESYFGALELDSVPLGVPDLLGALKTDRVDGCYGPPLAAVAMQWYNELSHVSAVPLQYGIGANVVRAERWKALSASDQRTEDRIVEIMSRKVNQRVQRDNDRALDAMLKQGMRLVEPPAGFVADLRAAAEASWPRLAGQVYSRRELDMVLRHRAEFRAQASK